MKKHFASQHWGGENNIAKGPQLGPWPCQFCGRTYKSKNSLSSHVSMNHRAEKQQQRSTSTKDTNQAYTSENGSGYQDGANYSDSTPHYSDTASHYSDTASQYSSGTPQYNSTPQYRNSTPQYSSTTPQYSSTTPTYNDHTNNHYADVKPSFKLKVFSCRSIGNCGQAFDSPSDRDQHEMRIHGMVLKGPH